MAGMLTLHESLIFFKCGANVYVNILCDVSAIVNESFIFTIVLMSHIYHIY